MSSRYWMTMAEQKSEGSAALIQHNNITTNDTRTWLQIKVIRVTGYLDMDMNMNSRIDIWERHDA